MTDPTHPPTIKVRRIVTGHDADGRSTAVIDEQVESNGFPGGSAAFFWGTETTPTYPDEGAEPVWEGAFPGVGGTRCSVSHFLPGQAKEYDEFVASVAPDPVPGMHRTDTLDYAVLLAGELRMELEDGAVDLRPHDVVIQNGTRHRWVNTGDEPAVLLAISVGANRVDPNPTREDS